MCRKPRATVSADGQAVTLSRGAWSTTFSAAMLARWIAFYRGLASRTHPRFGGTPLADDYAPVVRALEKALQVVSTLGGPAGPASEPQAGLTAPSSTPCPPAHPKGRPAAGKTGGFAVSRNRIVAKVRTNPDYQALTRHLDSLDIRWATCPPEAKGHPYLLITDAAGESFRHTISCMPRST